MEDNKRQEDLDRIARFLEGRDPMERIVSVECGYADEWVFVIYKNENGKKLIKADPSKPFIWAKNSAIEKMLVGCRTESERAKRKREIHSKMKSYGIGLKKLNYGNKEVDRLSNGYIFLFYAEKQMSQRTFSSFFTEVGSPIRPPKNNKKNKEESAEKDTRNTEYLQVSPIEQYLIATGKRFFKGYNGYDDLKRLVFDLETTGLNPHVDSIDQIGIRTNKGFERVLSVDTDNGEERKRSSELAAIMEFTRIIKEEKPDIIMGHNSEDFDWPFIITRSEINGYDYKDLSASYFPQKECKDKYGNVLYTIPQRPIFKQKNETILKLGGEVEKYHRTILWGHSIIDSLHAVRRAQAIDSSMKSARLKYVTKYMRINKPNRVYVDGNEIGKIWRVLTPSYAFNNENGKYYRITDENPLKEGYEVVTGKYIVERYLLDDLWETDKVEAALNETNFLITKIVPTTFARACTMGTATIWKLIILAWYYENGLAVPAAGKNEKFVGGLSRLLKVGYADNVVKLDYNSLYPSIDLTWQIKSDLDISNSLLLMLDYVLTMREKFKGLKKKANKEIYRINDILANKENLSEEEIQQLEKQLFEAEREYAKNDKFQSQNKVLANSFFGSYGCPAVFPLGDIASAEKTTCVGRMCLRLMISHFGRLGYLPIVGDSFTSDTPLFVKYNDNNLVDIKTIGELISETDIEVDALGREYDYSEKPYKVLCRSGWVAPSYIYRHKTNKPIYKVQDGITEIDVTEDHSLFNSNKEKIKPSEINKNTQLEYYSKDSNIWSNVITKPFDYRKLVDKIEFNTDILNASIEIKKAFLEYFYTKYPNKINLSKRQTACLEYIKNCIVNAK